MHKYTEVMKKLIDINQMSQQLGNVKTLYFIY